MVKVIKNKFLFTHENCIDTTRGKVKRIERIDSWKDG